MKTRTLLLLSVGCGLAILVAGMVLVLQLAGQPAPAAPLAIGATGQAGDLVVTVRDVAGVEEDVEEHVRGQLGRQRQCVGVGDAVLFERPGGPGIGRQDGDGHHHRRDRRREQTAERQAVGPLGSHGWISTCSI